MIHFESFVVALIVISAFLIDLIILGLLVALISGKFTNKFKNKI